MFVFVLFFITGCSSDRNVKSSSVQTDVSSIVSESSSTTNSEINQSITQEIVNSTESATTQNIKDVTY